MKLKFESGKFATPSLEDVKKALVPNIDNWIWKEETVKKARLEVWGF